ncbi:hypothetical protein H5410_059874 [Solanum commersonii]|uniref:Uncharacterized protein n=1 Tax=Solanum commersonii TaxID=4109 RepID=A0A9J5W4B2_SOLCO|nr:hypothetical protein H5410_059874 [Solanum commersonii]
MKYCSDQSLNQHRQALESITQISSGKLSNQSPKSAPNLLIIYKGGGRYITEAAREIGEKIEEIRSQRLESIVKVSPNDALHLVWYLVPNIQAVFEG